MSDSKKGSPEGIEPKEKEQTGESRETLEGPEERSGSSRRLILLLILLLVAAGGGLFWQLGGSEPEVAFSPAPRTVVESKPVAMPVPPPPAAEKGEGKGAKESGSAPVKAAAPDPAPVAQATASPAPSQPAPAPAAAPAPAPQKKAAFALETEPFLFPARLAEAEELLRSLGFKPSRTPAQQMAALTRLRLGVHPADEAPLRLQEARAVIPSAFPLRQGDEIAIYAGSFLDLDRARIFADELYEQGIRVEEEKAQLSVSAPKLRFGAFSDEEEADAAAARLRDSGLEIRTVRLP